MGNRQSIKGTVKTPKKIVILTTSISGGSRTAFSESNRLRLLLEIKGFNFEEIDLSYPIDTDPDYLNELKKKAKNTIPALFADEEFIGGYNNIQELEDREVLDIVLF